MRKHVFILCFLVSAFNEAFAQVTLTIRQAGTKGDSIPEITLVDYETIPYKLVNDTTLTYVLDIKNPESLFIGIDPETGWFTRVWLDPQMKTKEITIDYSTETSVSVINPTKEDTLFEKVFSYLRTADRRESDSIAMAYVEKHPDSYLSLYFVSHGLYRNDRERRLMALNMLGSKFKDHPDYIRIQSTLLSRRNPSMGDSFKEFSLSDVNDENFNSASITNKWVLLHFWSNGCIPCVKEMDSLVACYNSLDTAKITFISVAMDDKRENWQNSTATHKISWVNLWQPDGGVGELCLHYNVSVMPYFILFDDQKKLVSIRFGSEELANLKEMFISNDLIKK